jgi:hypothetical protein
VAGLEVSDIGYINAHGTGTVLNDAAEARAINRWAGEQAGEIPVSSTKGGIGHLLGAAGAVETVLCLMVLREGWLPPTVGSDGGSCLPVPSCNEPTRGTRRTCADEFLWVWRCQRHFDPAEVVMSGVIVAGVGAVSRPGGVRNSCGLRCRLVSHCQSRRSHDRGGISRCESAVCPRRCLVRPFFQKRGCGDQRRLRNSWLGRRWKPWGRTRRWSSGRDTTGDCDLHDGWLCELFAAIL